MRNTQVEILQATKPLSNGRGRRRAGVQIDRIRVAAYCRVSTDGDEQLGSFASQKAYYEDKIRENPQWALAGIFADEAITGTKADKRPGFQEMIQRCMNGEIDINFPFCTKYAGYIELCQDAYESENSHYI